MNKPFLGIAGAEIIANEASRNCVAPAVTVLVSLYNYSAYITGCLDSVRASDTEGLPGGFDVVVVDDGSTDGSAAAVEKYLAASPLPVCLIKKSVNSGVADTRNLGLLAARAPLIFILDADNEIRPQCLLAHHHAITSSGVAMVYGLINRFDSGTRQTLGLMSEAEWDVRELLTHPCIDAMAMVRKDAVLRVGGYSPEYRQVLRQGWEDYDLWLKLAQAGERGGKIPQVLGDYRAHPQSMIQDAQPFQLALAVYFGRKFFPLVQSHPGLPVLFGVSRRELAIASGQGIELSAPPAIKPPKFIHRLLGRKMCRSLCKRLASIYCWLHP